MARPSQRGALAFPAPALLPFWWLIRQLGMLKPQGMSSLMQTIKNWLRSAAPSYDVTSRECGRVQSLCMCVATYAMHAAFVNATSHNDAGIVTGTAIHVGLFTRVCRVVFTLGRMQPRASTTWHKLQESSLQATSRVDGGCLSQDRETTLQFLRRNQATLHADLHRGVREHVVAGDAEERGSNCCCTCFEPSYQQVLWAALVTVLVQWCVGLEELGGVSNWENQV